MRPGPYPGRIVNIMDEPATATPARRRALGGLLARRGRAPPPPAALRRPRASPRSTTTARCARACPRPSTGRARRPSSARPSWASCWRGSATTADRSMRWRPVILTRADAAQVELVMADHPGGRPHGHRVGHRGRPGPWRALHGGVAPGPAAAGPDAGGHRRDLRPARGPRVRGHPHRPRTAARPLLADCGVAGVHRLLASADELADADAVVVVAGMEGALASLVGGITPAPVVAVPTSTGYGAALEGVTALLAMHASCAAGITVVGHRQRVRGGVRHRPDAAVSRTVDADRPSPASASVTGPTAECDGGGAAVRHGGLVPLLRRHRRGHGPRQPARRRRRPRRGAGAARAAAPRRLGARGRAGAARAASPPPGRWSA